MSNIYEVLYIYANGKYIKVSNGNEVIYSANQIWMVTKKTCSAGELMKQPIYKVYKSKFIGYNFRQITIPGTTKHFKTLEEALMYVSIQE